MTEWKLIQGSQAERPAELDKTSSPTTVYQRRNIKRVTVTHDDKTSELWEYEERELTVAECEEMERSVESPAIQQVMQAISSVELSIEMLSLGEL